MKLGISNIAWADHELEAALDIMERVGARGLEIAPGLAFAGEPDVFAPSASAISSLRRRLDARGVSLISMQSLLFGVENAHLFGSPEAHSRFEQAISRAIVLAGALAIPNLVLGSPRNREIPDGMARDDAHAVAVKSLRRLGDRALAANTNLALEPNPAAYGTNFLNTLCEAAAFADEVDHPAVTVNFDIGALHLNGEVEQAGALYALARARVSHVHVSEPQLAPAPAEEGVFAKIAADLLRQGYEGWFSIEMRPVEPDRLDAVARALAIAARALKGAGA